MPLIYSHFNSNILLQKCGWQAKEVTWQWETIKHTHTRICMYICTSMYIYLMVSHVYILYMCVYVYVHICIQVYACAHVCMCAHVHVCIYIYVCVYLHVYTHTHTFIPIQGCTIGWITTVFYAQELCLHKLMDFKSKIMQLHYNVIILYHRASYVGYLGHLVDTDSKNPQKISWRM